jgi:tetratricopeptide (TPR) repeat protein
MKCLAPLLLLTTCFASGCTRDALEDMSAVPAADRAALQACMATPDLAGNHWPERAGKARCWLSLPQNPSLQDVSRMLKEPQGDLKLDRRYAEILSAHFNDPAHRDLLFLAYKDFRTEEGQRVAAEWFAKVPGSAFARAARGDAILGMAWKARGHAFASQTSDAQLDSMTSQLKIAVPLLESALRDEPKLSPACVDLIDIGNLVDATPLRDSAMQHCSAIDPLSWHVNSMYLTEADPRWGGSFDKIDQAVEQIRLRVKESPMLASLLAKGIGRRAFLPLNDDSNLLPIAGEIDRAALAAPDPYYIAKAGLAAEQGGNLAKAGDDFSQALRFAPDDPNILTDRAELSIKTNDRLRALNDAQRAARQPDDCECTDHATLATVFRDLDRVAEERTELLRVGHDDANRQWALSMLCKTYITGAFDSAHALPCAKQLVEEFPDDSEALYLRALTLYAVHDPAATQFDKRFREHVGASDPARSGEIEQLDELAKGQSGS